MDRIAAEGVTGMLETVPEGCLRFHCRQPLRHGIRSAEVVGRPRRFGSCVSGVELGPTDHAMRMNLIHIANGNIITHSGGNISTEEAHELLAALKSALEPKFPGVILHPGVSYRHVMQFTRPVSKAVQCAPPHDYLDQPLEPLLPTATDVEGEETAELYAH